MLKIMKNIFVQYLGSKLFHNYVVMSVFGMTLLYPLQKKMVLYDKSKVSCLVQNWS
jgi:hypothetical protein